MKNPLKELAQFKQSPWYDNLRRSLITSGELERLIKEDGLKGLTSNPTIFEQAIAGSSDYDETLGLLVRRGERDPKKIFETLAVHDIRHAADIFLPVYKETGGADGFVSLEVSPDLAHDTEGTLREARRLFSEIGRPNVMIKVPATLAGIPAIEQLIGEGINVNVTLIFSLERYEAVAGAYLAGLERLAKSGKQLAQAASVASFFISRIDAAADKKLEEKISGAQDPAARASLQSLLGKTAIANAKVAYQTFKTIFSSARFEALQDKGAKAQRVLWASTGTKNPSYSDVYYVEELIGPDTVDTIPPATWNAFRDHGKPRASLEEDVQGAQDVLARLKAADVSLGAITAKLEADGVKSFADSFGALRRCITAKVEMIRAGAGRKPSAALGNFQKAFEESIQSLKQGKAADRLWRKDASLWKSDPKHQAIIKDALGWLDMPEAMAEKADELKAFAEEVRKDGITHVLLLGMGGSSLAPEVFRRTFAPRPGFPTLHVLDSTDPEAVLFAERETEPAKTLYIVASKSGTTTEPLRFFDYFYSKARAAKGEDAGKHFVAITDSDSFLEKLAREKGFRRVFINPSYIGGRYSALSYFGLVPAALMGVDISTLLDRAQRLSNACASCVPPSEHPGLWLGAVLGTLALKGRDKVTFLVLPEISSLGLWLEQLLAESTGKEGKGVIPISGEPIMSPEKYGNDRVFIHIRLDSAQDRSLDELTPRLEKAGHPVIRIPLADPIELGAEFYRWEVATAVLGHILGINPFDQPNVQEAKDRTKDLLDQAKGRGAMPALDKHVKEGDLSLAFSKAARRSLGAAGSEISIESALHRFLAQVKPGNYVGLLPYLSPSGEYEEGLQNLRAALLGATQAAVQFGYGPRYLHSTGQLHKGGPNSGVFLILSRRGAAELSIEGSPYTFGQLIAAQSLGDFQALDAMDRPAVFIEMEGNPKDAIRTILNAVETAGQASLRA
ncbi:MAG: transaldolase [Elusimicrobia bacterium CG_4_10_14_0_2_um_filter_63_34]|nr:MAG: transaldolase [Elusimicrobia bacterium CG_4_10_14_0_2_um_filter_63_34]